LDSTAFDVLKTLLPVPATTVAICHNLRHYSVSSPADPQFA
jgi:hypothetical protein